MKHLLQKIKMILKNRRFRRIWYRTVGLVSAVMVFITTYALVMPAITLDVSTASMEPGIVFEQNQYRTPASNVTVAAAENSSEETAVETAAEDVQIEEVQVEEPEQEEPQASAEESASEETEASEEETSAEAAPVEEDAQTETPADDTQEEAAAEETEASEEETSAEAAPVEEEPQTEQTEAAPAEQPGTTEEAAATAATEQAAEFQIPELRELDFDEILTGRTGFYYYHNENADAEGSVSSDSVDDWKKADADTVLASADFVRVYLSYEIPAGALNETNQTALFRLPGNLHITDKQVRVINKFENGIYKETGDSKYLGAEAIEGTRTPDEKLHDGEEEYISALVKVENLSDGGQNLVFTFTPYTIGKNQTAYDQNGQVTAKGQKVKGWFTVDFTVDQIDWDVVDESTETVGTAESGQGSAAEAKTVTTTTKKAEIDFTQDMSTVLTLVEKEETAAEAADQTAMPAQSFEKTIKVATGKVSSDDNADDLLPEKASLTVRAEADEGTFPAGTTMVVTPVTGNDLDAVAEAVENTLDAKTRGFQAVDITFYNAEGVKIEPAKPIRVTMTSDTIAKASESPTTGDPVVIHIDDEGQASTVESSPAPADDADSSDTVEFESDSFSTYVLAYTVDFEYNEYKFSMPGNGSILLSQLFDQLGIDASAADAESVRFTNESLIKVEKSGEDWKLTSIRSFTSEEALTITMADGTVYKVKVTDPANTSSNLADFLVDATIGAPKDENGNYIVRLGDAYNITLRFQEDSLQFNNSGVLTYTMPEGLEAIEDSGNISITVTTHSGTYVVPGNTWSISNGRLEFNWSSNPEIQKVFANNNTQFSITFEGKFNGQKKEIQFSDTVTKTVEVKDEHKVSVTKVGNAKVKDNKISYTVNIQSTGKNSNVVISDTVNGTGLILDRNSITARSTSGNPVTLSPNATGNAGNSFSYTIPEMSNGEIITLTYDVTVDPAAIQMVNEKVVATADNGAKVVSDENPEGDTVNVHSTIDYTPTVSKSNGTVTDQTDITTTLQWKIIANPDAKVSMAGGKITDTIDSGSQGIMRYSGQGVTIVKKDSSGNVVGEPTLVGWDQLTAHSDSAWTYTVPSSDQGHAYTYEITYTTDVDTASINNLTTVKNVVTTDGGKQGEGTGQVGPTGGERPEIQKSVNNVDLKNQEISWHVVFTVPPEGLSKAVVTDNYPMLNTDHNGADHNFIDNIKGQLTRENITGLKENEDFTVEYNEDKFVITFYKDQSHINPGLNGDAVTRTISIDFKTEIDAEWLEKSPDFTDIWKWYHKNIVTLDWDNGQVKAEAQTTVQGKNLDKKGGFYGYREVNGVRLPVYKYSITFTGVTDVNNTITDTFDTSILEPYRPENTIWNEKPFKIFGGDQYYFYYGEGTREPQYLLDNDGIIFHTDADSLPVSEKGFYPSYILTYYLTVKDEQALNKLMGLAANEDGGKYMIRNHAEWEGHGDDVEIEYTYEGLKKELLTPEDDLKPDINGDIFADFRITLNPGALVMNNMEPMTMTDTFNHLSIDYNSITATPPEGVTWDFSGNTATFTIPDATEVVIDYRARVLFSSLGEVGETVTVHFDNTATMKGYSKSIEGDASRENSGGGVSSEYWINLMKYEAGDMNHRLAGAVFALYLNDQPVLDKNGSPVTFTTGDDGMITVVGDEQGDGWSVHASNATKVYQYKLKEITAPEGYKLPNFDFEFRISEDGTTDYQHYVYHNGDTMSAKNYPGTDVKVYKQWSNGNDKHEADTVTVKLQQKIGDNGKWSDSIRLETADGWKDQELTLTLSSSNDWQDIFKELPLVVPVGKNFDGEDTPVTYRIVETQVNGQDVDPETVTITKNEGDGAYSFTVTNTVAERYTGTVEFKARKIFNNGDLTAGQFSFQLFERINGSLELRQTQPTASNGTVAFDAITFIKDDQHDDEGDHFFVIKEVVPVDVDENNVKDGIKYDTTEKTIKVTVTLNEETGRLDVVKEPEEENGFDGTWTNEQLKDFAFYKVWHDTQSNTVDWDENVAKITVTVGRKAGDSEDSSFTYTYEASKGQFTEAGTEIEAKESGADANAPKLKLILVPSTEQGGIPQYKFYMENLEAAGTDGDYTYFVRETKVDGYLEPTYGVSGTGTSANVTEATDGGTIFNTPEEAIELPHTGGPGTKLFTLLGSMLLLGAGMVLIMRRRITL